MEINGKNNSIPLLNYTRDADWKRRTTSSESEDAGRGTPQDRVALSGKAKEVHSAAEQLKTIPDVRSEKVEALKARVENGTYSVDGKIVAARLLRESILNQFL